MEKLLGFRNLQEKLENVPIGEKPESSNIWVTEMQLCVAIIRFDFCRWEVRDEFAAIYGPIICVHDNI